MSTADRKATHLYLYGTGDREDGIRYALGMAYDAGPANGSMALFQELSHAKSFASTLAASLNVPLHALPSAVKVSVSWSAAREEGALDGWDILCSECGFVAGYSLEGMAHREADGHRAWHVRGPAQNGA